jgi:hypothetical protein
MVFKSFFMFAFKFGDPLTIAKRNRGMTGLEVLRKRDPLTIA